MDLPKDSDYVNLYFVSDGYGQGLGFDIHITQLFNTCEGHGAQGKDFSLLTFDTNTSKILE